MMFQNCKPAVPESFWCHKLASLFSLRSLVCVCFFTAVATFPLTSSRFIDRTYLSSLAGFPRVRTVRFPFCVVSHLTHRHHPLAHL